jgi:hypothetical protein
MIRQFVRVYCLLLPDRHGMSYNATDPHYPPRNPTMTPVILEIFTDYI